MKEAPTATLMECPTRVQAAGNKPKLIDECIGRINSGSSAVSIARMQSPPGRQEPEQTPEFEEDTGGLAWDAAGTNETGGAARAGVARSDDRSRRVGTL
jgi:hypothetical protein